MPNQQTTRRLVDVYTEPVRYDLPDKDLLEILDLMVHKNCKFSDIVAIIRVGKWYNTTRNDHIIDIKTK